MEPHVLSIMFWLILLFYSREGVPRTGLNVVAYRKIPILLMNKSQSSSPQLSLV
jgi:hypothetical protein